MHEYDDAVLQCFLENQLQLFPGKGGRESGSSRKLSGGMHGCSSGFRGRGDRFFEEEGLDMDGATGEEILEADEVFVLAMADS